jgi:signal transduction histidine kinase
MNRYTSYIITLLGFITVFLSIDITYKYHQFLHYHQTLSYKTITSTASEIETILTSLQRELQLFVTQEHLLLSRLYFNSKDNSLKQQLNNKIQAYFPQFLEFTLANHKGQIIVNHNIFTTYPQCVQSIKQISKTKQSIPLTLHQNPFSKKQHYDIMQTFTPSSLNQGKNQPSAVFFISYSVAPLKQLLTNRQIENHSLFIVNTQTHKIALTPKKRHSIHFTKMPAKNKQTINNTQWVIIDQLNQSYRQTELITLFIQHSLLFIFFIIISTLFIKAIRTELTNNHNSHILLKGVENERRRISMEMHDHILADITHLSRKIMSHPPLNYQQINQQLLEMTTSIRYLIDDLHPNSLDLLGIEATLQSYINKHLSMIDNPQYSLTIDPDIDSQLKPYEKYTLFRILIELINNIINHAQATHYTIIGRLSPTFIIFKITDNGMGLPENHKLSLGRGLNNIRSRCQMLGASFSITDHIPQGTISLIQFKQTQTQE